MANTFELIASSTVGSGGAASIDFTSISGSYTDLVIKASTRADNAATYSSNVLQFNSSTSGYSFKIVYGNSTAAVSLDNSTTGIEWIWSDAANATASTFGNSEIYIPNYASSNYKSVSIDSVSENNLGTTHAALAGLMAGLWSNTAAITSIKLKPSTGSFVQYSTAYLYGVKNA